MPQPKYRSNVPVWLCYWKLLTACIGTIAKIPSAVPAVVAKTGVEGARCVLPYRLSPRLPFFIRESTLAHHARIRFVGAGAGVGVVSALGVGAV